MSPEGGSPRLRPDQSLLARAQTTAHRARIHGRTRDDGLPSRAEYVADPELFVAPDMHRRIGRANAAAAAYYADTMNQHPQIRHDFLGRLGRWAVVPEAYSVGYAPPGATNLLRHMRALGWSDNDLIESGLVQQTQQGRLIDRFRDRIMFSIRTPDGEIAGFTGRDRSGQAAAKYLNTNATRLFDKGRLLIGVSEQRAQLESGVPLTWVEGPVDQLAIVAHRDPTRPVACVTTSGTALTADHVAIADHLHAPGALWTFAFDADQAGQHATERAAEMTLHLERPVRIATLPQTLDPAALAERESGHVLRHFQPERTQDAASWLIDQRLKRHADRLGWVDGRVDAMYDAASIIARLPFSERIDRGLQLAQRLDIDPVHIAPAIAASQHQGHDALGRLQRRHPPEVSAHTPPELRSAQSIKAALAAHHHNGTKPTARTPASRPRLPRSDDRTR